jgi:hypothetical protein
MSKLTLRRIKDNFLVTDPDIAPATFETRREAKDWCAAHPHSMVEVKDLKSGDVTAVANRPG